MSSPAATAGPSRNVALLAIVLVALVLRVGLALITPVTHDNLFLDEVDYDHLARSVVAGTGIALPYSDECGLIRAGEPTGYYEPIYPLWLSFFHYLFPDNPYIWIQLAQCVLGALTCVFAFKLLTNLGYEPRVGLIAALGVAVYPFAVFFSVHIFTEVVYCFLLLWFFASFITPDWSLRRALGTGLLFGLASNARGITLAFLPFPLLMLFLEQRRAPRMWATIVLFIAGVLTVLTPWVIRNKLVVGGFFVQTRTGCPLIQGTNPLTEEERQKYASDVYVGRTRDQVSEETKAALARTANEAEREPLLVAEGLGHVWNHPSDVMQLYWMKVKRYWRPFAEGGTRTTRFNNVVIALSYFPLVALGLYGIWICRANRRLYVLAAYIAYCAVIQPVFVASTRHRFPSDLLLIAFAAVAVDRLLSPDRKQVNRVRAEGI